MATATDRLIIDIVVKALKAQEELKKVTKTGKDFEESLENITTKEKALNELGIQTQAQIQKQIKLRKDLIKVLGTEEPQAVRRLSAEIEQLNLRQAGAVESTRQQEQALFSMGFILDDARQFSVDFGAGLRAISNNLQPLITQISRAEGGMKGWISTLKGPAGAIIAMNTMLAVLALFEDEIGELLSGPSSVKELTSQLEGLVSLRLPDLSFKTTGEEAASVAENTKEKLDDLDEAIQTRYTRNFELFGVNVARSIGAPVLRALASMGVELTDREKELISFADTGKNLSLVEDVFKGLSKEADAYAEALRILQEEGIDPVNPLIEELLKQLNDGSEAFDTYTGALREYLVGLTQQAMLLQQNVDLGKEQAELDALRIGNTAELLESGKVNLALIRGDIDLTQKKAALDLLQTTGLGDLLAEQRKELKLLEDRIALEKELADIRAGALGTHSSRLVDIVPEDGSELFDTLSDISEQDAEDIFNASINEAKSFVKGWDREAKRIENINKRLASSLTTGLAQAIGSTVEALANGGSAGEAILSSLGGLAVRMGRLMIAFGTAALKLRTLITNPVTAIAAGAALVALGTLAKRSAGSLFSGGSASAPGVRVRDNTGLASSYERSNRALAAAPAIAGINGVAPHSVNVNVTGELFARRGSYHASVREGTLRHERMRSTT